MRRLRSSLLGCAACLILIQAHAAENAASTAPPRKEAIPYKREDRSGTSLAYETVVSLIVVGLVGYAAALALKKTGAFGELRARSGRRLKLVETLRLSRQSTVFVVEYKGVELVLLESAHGTHRIDRGVLPSAAGEDHA